MGQVSMPAGQLDHSCRAMYDFEDFCRIVAALRAEDGCPWDRVQTHESMKPCMINETAEAVAAINIYQKTGNSRNFCEELGDMLLQVVLQSRIAEEEGIFTIRDVIQTISEKMIRRHPHVFGEKSVELAGEVIKEWDAIKQKEKSGMSEEEKQAQKYEVFLAEQEIVEHLQKSLDKYQNRDYK